MMTVGNEGSDRPVGHRAGPPDPGFRVAQAFDVSVVPAAYDAEDVDEMMLGQLAALRELRDRLVARPNELPVAVVDQYAQELVDQLREDDDDE